MTTQNFTPEQLSAAIRYTLWQVYESRDLTFYRGMLPDWDGLGDAALAAAVEHNLLTIDGQKIRLSDPPTAEVHEVIREILLSLFHASPLPVTRWAQHGDTTTDALAVLRKAGLVKVREGKVYDNVEFRAEMMGGEAPPAPEVVVEPVEPTPELKPDTTDENDDTTPEPKPEPEPTKKSSTPPRPVMSDDFVEAFNFTITEIREVRRDIRQALAPVVAAKTDTDAAHDLIRNSDEMTGKVLFRVVVCLHTYGEMTRTELRKKMNSTRLPHLPEAIALGLRIGAVDANARGGKALRLIDHSAVMTDADLERAAADQRARDESNRRRPAFGRAS